MKNRLLALLLLAAPALSLRALDHDKWLADFRQVLEAMSSHYANLDSAIDDRKMDLPALRKRTEDRLRAVKDDAQAREAIDAFLAEFGDGHVRMVWPAAAPATDGEPAKARPLCERLGYETRPPRGTDFTSLPEFRAMDHAWFPGGVLRLDAQRQAGIIRLRLFSEQAHGADPCTAALEALGIAPDAAECDGMCAYRIQLAAGDVLTASLAGRAEELRKAGATMLVLDLSGNGGGSDWVEPAIRTLSPKPLQAARLGFVKHPHWVTQIRDRIGEIEYDQQSNDLAMLKDAHRSLRAGLERAGETCDRMGVWNDPPQRPRCSLLVSDLLYASGSLPYAKPGSIPETFHSRAVLFKPTHYTYTESANTLPLIVLVDSGTASASEQAVSMLQDAKAAVIAGTPTRGAGCGHTNGGIDTLLKNSGATLKLPDCVRFRKDGSNEVVGITPDVVVPWRFFDSPAQRARKVLSVLRQTAR
jgi:hypothetical protein